MWKDAQGSNSSRWRMHPVPAVSYICILQQNSPRIILANVNLGIFLLDSKYRMSQTVSVIKTHPQSHWETKFEAGLGTRFQLTWHPILNPSLFLEICSRISKFAGSCGLGLLMVLLFCTSHFAWEQNCELKHHSWAVHMLMGESWCFCCPRLAQMD